MGSLYDDDDYDEIDMLLAQTPELWFSNYQIRTLAHVLIFGCNCDGYDACGDCVEGKSNPHPRWIALAEELENHEQIRNWYRCRGCGSGSCDCS
jgi:hypothetical protein